MSVQLYGSLTIAARLAAVQYVLGLAAPPPAGELWMALYSNSANPDNTGFGGDAPLELTVSGYARVGPVALADTDGTFPLVTTAEIAWTGLGATHLGGIALLDTTSGQVYAYADCDVDLADGASVTIAPGNFSIT